jgi:tetratricopeptide (TPR) repeat protein
MNARTLLVLLLFPATAALAAPEGAFRFLVAQSLAAEGRLSEALGELEAIGGDEREDPFLLLEQARLRFHLGQLEEASRDLSRVRALLPGELEALRLQGRVELALAVDDPAAAARAREAFEALRTRDPEDLETLVSLGQLYLAAGLAAQAAEVLGEASRFRPDHPWIESLRSRARALMEDTGRLEREEQRTLERDPYALDARLELAERLGRQGRFEEALSLLRDAPREQASRPEVRERLARWSFHAGHPEEARKLAAELLGARPAAVPLRLLKARSELALGYFPEAAQTLAPLGDRASEHWLVGELLLRALEGQGEFEAAAELLEQRLARLRARAETSALDATTLELARLWSRAGEGARAVATARQILHRQAPQWTLDALQVAVRALAAGGEIDEALTLLAESSNFAEEEDWKLGLLRLDVLLAGGRELAAARELESLLARAAPGRALAVGGVLQDRQRYERALPLLVLAQQEEEGGLEASFRIASCLERLGRYEEAIAEFRRLVARAPRFAPALNYLGYLWIERAENLDEAVRMVREAVRLEPENGAYVDSLGWGYFQLGRIPEAVDYLERAARLLPEDATVLEHLGDALLAQGDREGARAAYRRALVGRGAEGAEHAELARKLAHLDSGGS